LSRVYGGLMVRVDRKIVLGHGGIGFGLPVVLVFLAWLPGCGGSAATSAATAVPPPIQDYMPDAPPERGDWLRLRLPAEMPHLNPLTSSDAYADEILAWIFDPLLDRDPQTLEMRPWLASSWDYSEDHLQYVFHLRPGVVFSDGHPLTAEDVKFTFDMIRSPLVDAPQLRNYFVDITSVDVLDEHTVRFTCDKPYYRHLIMIGGMYIIPKHIYGEGDFNRHPANRAPVGSGPYRLERWKTGQELVLVRNDRWWGAELTRNRPYFDRIIYTILTEDNSAFLLLARGDLDTMALRPDIWERRAATPRFTSRFNRFAYDRPAYTYIGWNLRDPRFADRRVRRALAMLMDRDAIRDGIYKGLATIVTSGFMPGTPEFNPNVKPVPYDPEGARKLLAEAGWRDSNGDGLLDRDGVSLKFEVATTNQNPLAEQILTLYKEALAREGIELVIRPMEWASLLDRVDKREFEAVLMGWQMPPDPDPYQVWHSSQADAGSNYVGFVNEEADRLIVEARACFDRNERIRMYHRFQEILDEEQPYLFLIAPKALLAVDRRIYGIRTYPFGMDQREWFVPRQLQRFSAAAP